MMITVITICMFGLLFQNNILINAGHLTPTLEPTGPSYSPTTVPTAPTPAPSSRCSYWCYQSDLGDGYCDYYCNNAACHWDEGDCPTPYPTLEPTLEPTGPSYQPTSVPTAPTPAPSSQCSSYCYQYQLGNGYCNYYCNNAACNWDDGDCSDDDDWNDYDCSWFCNKDKLGDGTCNYWCSGGDCNYDHGDCTEQCSQWNGCSLDSVYSVQCGIFSQPSDKWCEFDGAMFCCSDSTDINDINDCCDANYVAIFVPICVIVALIVFGVWACCCRKRRDNTNDPEPRFCYKLWCPICSIFSYQGNESRGDLCMTCFCCCIYSLCCWTPKRVVVDEIENNNNSIEMTVAYINKIDDIDKIRTDEVYTKTDDIDKIRTDDNYS